MRELKEMRNRIGNAMDILQEHGQAQGEEKKAWVIDQVTRALLGCIDGVVTSDYLEFVEDYESGNDGPLSFVWDTGVAP